MKTSKGPSAEGTRGRQGLLDLLVPGRRRRRELAWKNHQLESFLATVPLEYCGWDDRGAQALSSGFAALAGMEKLETLADLAAAFPGDDGAQLSALYARLRRHGETFEVNLHAPGSNKSLRLAGRRGLPALPGAESFSVIWALDVTDYAAASMAAAQELETLRRREAEWRDALNALPFPLWLRAESLELSWCNRSYARIAGETPAAVVAEQRELPVRGAEGKEAARLLAQKAMGRLEPASVRGHLVTEGARKLVEVMEIPLPAEKRAVGVALDVTREEELEADYQRLGQNQREVLEQLRTAIAMFDRDTRLEFYNSAYEQLTGLPGTWLDSRPRMVDVIDQLRERRRLPEQADYRPFKQAWLARFTSLLEPYEEMQYLPDGTVIRQTALARPMGGLLLTLEDVTSRLELETSYNTLVAVQQETMDNLAEGVAVFGEDGRLKLSNDAWRRMWNAPKAPAAPEGQGPHISRLVGGAEDFFDPGQWPAARQALLECALEREPRRGRMRRREGQVLEYSTVPLPDGNVLNAWFDITDTVKVEQALIEKNAALEEAERLKTEFLANVSYQLRTPLNAIMGFAEMLGQQYFGKLNERQLEYTSSMIEAGQRLVSLVNDILDLSTIEAGYLKLYPAPVRLKDLMAQVVQLTGEWARKQRIGAVIDCPDDISIRADERRMKQVLLNLISNAINYSPGGGMITLSARQEEGGRVALTVRDTGLGISDADLPRVFTPFERIRSGKAQRRSGAGLGLALVKSIVQLHGGTVSIESREGVGTAVTVRLPAEGPAGEG